MKLLPMTIWIDSALCYKSPDKKDAPESGVNPLCAFCGVISSPWRIGGEATARTRRSTPAVACPLCALPQHLERPRIDEEAVLVWLPEISQPALNTIMRGIHIALHALGEDVRADAVFRRRVPELHRLHVARAILTERSAAVATRLGTTSPRELGLALLELTPAATARRAQLLGGVKLLPLGRFFKDDHDVYPEIVTFWGRFTKLPPAMSERSV